MEYKNLESDSSRIVLEFLANDSIEHKVNNQSKKNLLNNENALSFLKQGEDVYRVILFYHDSIQYSFNVNDFTFIEWVFESNSLNYILPLVNIQNDYSILRCLFTILSKLLEFKQKEDSPFQNPIFAENLCVIIAQSENEPTIRLMCLKLINQLLNNKVFGNNIFNNLIHVDIPAILFTSEIIEPDHFRGRMSINNKKSYQKLIIDIVSETADLLANLAKYCETDDLSRFTPFLPFVSFFLKFNFSKIDENENVRLKFIYLLSTLMPLNTNRDNIYLLQIPELLLLDIVKNKKGIFHKYCYDVFYQIVLNDGLIPLFQSVSFYALTCNSIQIATDFEVISSIFNMIGVDLQYDFENLWTNDVISYVFEVLRGENYKFKVEASMLLLKFFEVSSQNIKLCYSVLHDFEYIQEITNIAPTFSDEQMMYFINVIYTLANSLSNDIKEEIYNCRELYDVIESLTANENKTIALTASKVLSLMNNGSDL